jgi:hypothetical protein
MTGNENRATMEEFEEWFAKNGFYTAPEFVCEKFYLKTGQRVPLEVEERYNHL